MPGPLSDIHAMRRARQIHECGRKPVSNLIDLQVLPGTLMTVTQEYGLTCDKQGGLPHERVGYKE